ncbi:MAG: glycosyltransferase family 2 protein [Rhodobacteraceae bacterium]|nr:glycosyltransferase family 2 protein [Paracoccaceae bacterium]
MNFTTLRNAYKSLKSLLAKYKNSAAVLSDIDMRQLCLAFEKIKEINDHSAILYVYETLRKQGALPRTVGRREGELRLYMLWLTARLKTVDYTQGGRLLAEALEQFPDHAPLQELHIFYLWFHDTQQLDRWIDARAFPDPVPEALLTVYGEHLIRTGKREHARAVTFLANTDPRRRHDLALLMINAAERPAQKLLWFNQFLNAQNMAPLEFKDPDQGFQIDNFTGAGIARNWSGAQPLVSVITTAYNCANFLETSATSILNQSYRNLELLIVDDCSDQPTREKIRDLAARDARVVPIFRAENGGTYIAKSAAMARAKGAFVIFHDADDWAHPDKLWREVTALQSTPELACWCSGWARMDEHGAFVMQLSGKYAHPNPAGTLLRHPAVYNRLGGFDPVRTGADSAYKRRIQLEFGPRSLRTDPTVLVLGRHHSESLTQAGHSSMGNFGWSPARALYRGNWLDPMITGSKTHWAPLGMRKTPIKIAYQATDVLVFDPLKRLGLSQKFDDFLLIIQGQISKRHLTQIHRLVMGLHQTGYHVGVYFEDSHWAKDTWQAQHFQKLSHIHCYNNLGMIRAKICLLVNGTAQGTSLRILLKDQIAVEDRVKARALPNTPAPVVQRETIFLLSPNLEKHLLSLSAISSSKLIVLARTGDGGGSELEGTRFDQISVADETGKNTNALLLAGPGWSDENRVEIAMLARYLGRKCLQTQTRLANITQIKNETLKDLPQGDQSFAPLSLSTPAIPHTGGSFVQGLAQDLSDHLMEDHKLNLELALELPENGL